jgi:hypothetical protein
MAKKKRVKKGSGDIIMKVNYSNDNTFEELL